LPNIVGLDRDRRRDAALYRLGLPRCPWPEDQHEVLALDADSQEPRSVGCRVLGPLLEAEDVRVEVERPVLVADEHARVEDLLQHRRSSRVGGHYLYDKWQRANVTADETMQRRPAHLRVTKRGKRDAAPCAGDSHRPPDLTGALG